MKEYTYKPFSDVLSVVPEEALPSMAGITFDGDHTVSIEDVYSQVRQFCSSRGGITDYVTLEFDELHCLADSILSIRVIDLSERETES